MPFGEPKVNEFLLTSREMGVEYAKNEQVARSCYRHISYSAQLCPYAIDQSFHISLRGQVQHSIERLAFHLMNRFMHQ